MRPGAMSPSSCFDEFSTRIRQGQELAVLQAQALSAYRQMWRPSARARKTNPVSPNQVKVALVATRQGEDCVRNASQGQGVLR